MRRRKKQLNYFRLFILISIIVLIFALIVLGIKSIINLFKKDSIETTNNIQEEIVSEITEEKQDITINMLAIGDAMCHSPNYKAAYNSFLGQYDFSQYFSDISNYTKQADIAIGNLETTFAGEEVGYSGYPTFNTPDSFGYELKNIGIDVLSTANNHSMDKGYKGVVRTLDKLDEIGISHMGTYRNEEEQNKVLTKDVNGIKIAFLSFTYGTNGMPVPSGKEYCINLIDDELIIKQIELAKKENPDLICVSMHWGIEYQLKQNKEQERLANLLFENGVDIILGSHPHVLQPMEKRTIIDNNGAEKEVFVIYSLGNFISNQSDEYTNDTVLLNIEITKKADGKITIGKITYIPIYVYDKETGGADRYKLLDINKNISDYEAGKGNISEGLYKLLKVRLEKIQNIVGQEII